MKFCRHETCNPTYRYTMHMFEDLNIAIQHLQQEDEPEFMPLFSLDEDEESGINDVFPEVLPILPLKNTILFPRIVIPITIGREKSIAAIQHAYEDKRLIAVLSQTDTKIEDPKLEDLYSVGTIAHILKILKMPDGTTTAILQGKKRFRIQSLVADTPFLNGKVEILDDEPAHNELEFEAMISAIRDAAKEIINLSPNIPNEALVMLRNINNPSFLLSFIASNMNIKILTKQEILEINNVQDRAHAILANMNGELQLLQLKDQIEGKVRNEMEKQQRDYFLNQQLKTIQEELGQNPVEEEIKVLTERAKSKKFPEKIAALFDKELSKIKRMNPQVAEYAIMLNYLETLLDLPWGETSKDNFDLKKVEKTLNDDHYGLEKIKTRILEHLAVLKLKGDMKAPILCFVGPPGVGKTSLGNSIARALKRKNIRISLGGLHDEAEIRGHRKTYIGAMPGRIIQSIKKSGFDNPVFILDEIDKVGKDFRGDPSSALLEVLDPEQNMAFYDNYLETEYDLSKVMFIATANNLNTIQPALLDRMEIIELSGYSIEEKVEIAKRHLIPFQLKEHGLKSTQVELSEEAIVLLIQNYTRESGVRSLNRRVGSVMRFVAKSVAMKEVYPKKITESDLSKILGTAFYSNELYTEKQNAGVAIGLAWTSVGGDILFLETSLSKGKGKLTLTGNLGDVMKESATTALSFLKAHASELNIPDAAFDEHDIHIHVPEGGIPKDGPSAGITMLTTLASAFINKPVKPHLAMTGEITLRGKVLPVGGIKEKILAAKRAGIKEIILCKDNRKHIEEIPENYINGLHFHYVDSMKEVLQIALYSEN
ncbi:MAG: endopeptidase La [Saprospiraceae bacterium]